MLIPRELRRLLLDWYQQNKRDLPWRRTRDPWRILLSEVMLQQTRVSVVIPYYERFLQKYPDPAALASANEAEYLAIWSGLGYYTRARNLQRAARALVEAGGFPRDYDSLLALPGVGEYTAAAIASIAFGLAHVVLDGNVMRLMSRLLADRADITSAKTRARLKDEAQRLLDPRFPADFNQALMELGATICLPRNPQCLLCPLRDVCEARRLGLETELPIKLSKRDPEKISLQILLVQKDECLLMRQRGRNETRLAGFWELPEARDLPKASRIAHVGSFRHSITRHDYQVDVWTAAPVKAPKGFRWIAFSGLEALPLATTVRKAIQCAGLDLARPEGHTSI